MKWTMIAAACILSAATVTFAGDAPTSNTSRSGENRLSGERPIWCKTGWECLRTTELADDAAYHLDLREQVAQYRLRARRFGLTVGFGLGVGGVVDKDFTVRYVPTGGAFLVWGLRF